MRKEFGAVSVGISFRSIRAQRTFSCELFAHYVQRMLYILRRRGYILVMPKSYAGVDEESLKNVFVIVLFLINEP